MLSSVFDPTTRSYECIFFIQRKTEDMYTDKNSSTHFQLMMIDYSCKIVKQYKLHMLLVLSSSVHYMFCSPLSVRFIFVY